MLAKPGSSPVSWECLFLVAHVDTQVPRMMPRPGTAYGHREPLMLDCEMLKRASGLGTGLTPVHHLNSFPFPPFLALRVWGLLVLNYPVVWEYIGGHTCYCTINTLCPVENLSVFPLLRS